MQINTFELQLITLSKSFTFQIHFFNSNVELNETNKHSRSNNGSFHFFDEKI
jgi:hypothetical protein